MRRVLGFFGGMIALAFGALRRQPRSRLALVGAAFCLLALTGTILLALGRGASPSTTVTDPATTNRVLATETATLTVTATLTATATKTTSAPQSTGKKNTSGVKDQFTAPPPLPTPSPATPTATPCPTYTAVPTDTATSGATASPSGSPGASYRHATTRPLDCTPCGTIVTPGPTSTPPADTIKTDLANAAQLYGLPPNLLYSEAYQESQWDPNAQSCDGGIGLMQIQYYTYPWLNSLNSGGCDGIAINTTNYDPYSAQGSADLGAKYLRWLKCLYEYNTPKGGTASAPVNGSSEYDYFHYSPVLTYPDTTLNGTKLPDCPASDGSSTATPTPQAGSCSLCQSIMDDNTNGPTATTYQDIQDPQGINGHWSCPFDPATGTSDYELLDVTISAYNEGPNNLANYGITNIGYVGSVEYWLTTQPWSAWA